MINVATMIGSNGPIRDLREAYASSSAEVGLLRHLSYVVGRSS